MRAIILPKNDVLTPTFTKYMLRMFDHGLLMKIQNNWYLSRGMTLFNIISNLFPMYIFSEMFDYHINKKKESELKPLSLDTFYTAFMIYAGLLIFATLSFFHELKEISAA